MALYVGEILILKATATNPLDDLPITDALGTVQFFEPGLSPATKPEDRTPFPGRDLAIAYDEDAVAYLAYVATAGWAAGKWSYRVQLAGPSFLTWEYGTFVLRA